MNKRHADDMLPEEELSKLRRDNAALLAACKGYEQFMEMIPLTCQCDRCNGARAIKSAIAQAESTQPEKGAT